MTRARGIQSLRSPAIRWPTMSKALQVSFPSLLRPSLVCTHRLGIPRNSTSRVAGGGGRNATAAARLNSFEVAMTEQKRQQLLARSPQRLHRAFASAHQLADGFVSNIWDPNRRQ